LKIGYETFLVNDSQQRVLGRQTVSLVELSNPFAMSERREDLNLGLINPPPNYVKGVESKFHIAELLGVQIDSPGRFEEKSRI